MGRKPWGPAGETTKVGTARLECAVINLGKSAIGYDADDRLRPNMDVQAVCFAASSCPSDDTTINDKLSCDQPRHYPSTGIKANMLAASWAFRNGLVNSGRSRATSSTSA